MDITTPPVEPVYNASASGLKRNGNTPTDVRAFIKTEVRKEISGVPCAISTKYYSASVITPATVILPSFADKTPPLSMTCRHEEQEVTRSFAPINETVNRRTAQWGGGLLTYAIVAASTKPENSVFIYQELSADFAPDAK